MHGKRSTGYESYQIGELFLAIRSRKQQQGHGKFVGKQSKENMKLLIRVATASILGFGARVWCNLSA